MTLSMLTIEGTWRDISAAPLARAVAMTATVQTPADHVIPDEALNRILGLSRTCQTDPDGLARVQVVKAPGVVYRVVFGGVVGHLRCDDWDDDATVPFVGIKDVPGGDVEVDPITWDAVLSGLAGRIAAQVPPAVRAELPGALAEQLADPTTQTRQALAAVTLSVAEGPYDVHRGGVIGTGDDTAAIKQAIINAGDGASVRFRPGVTYIVSDVIIPRPGQTLILTGATLKWKDGTAHKSGLIYAGVSVTTEPWSVIGGTIDMNRNNTPALANKETTGCGIHITASGAGWTGAYVLDGVTVLNAPGNAFRVLGTASAVMGTTNADAANTADSAVHINRPVVRNSYRGILVDRAGGCVINSPDIINTDRDGIYQFLCRSLQVTGGVIRNAGTSGNLTGHGLVDIYGVGTVWQGTEVIGASYNGFCAGGGEPTNAATRDFRWMGLRASGASCGLSIDITLTGGSTVAGHTVYAGAQLVGNTAVNNGIHGLYLHSASAVNVAALTAMGNAQSGIAGDSYRCTIDSADLQHNTFGLNLQGGTPVKTDGSALGVSGKYTGYGQWRIGYGVRSVNNTSEDILIGTGTTGYLGTTFDLEGDGSPETVQRATVGSMYRDRTAGALYIKTAFNPGTGTNGKTGWRQIALV